jgi:hypothetical protein
VRASRASRAIVVGAAWAIVVGCHGDPVSDFSGDSSPADTTSSSDVAAHDSTLEVATDGSDAADETAVDETATDVDVTDSGATCGAHPGPSMIAIAIPDAGPTFCIDSTEVTAGQYAAFVGATLTTHKCPTGQDYAAKPASTPAPEDPVVGVLWCMAYDYCQWAGKRLCGNIYGGAVAFGSRLDVAKDQWYFACSNGKGTKYPYGATYDSSKCAGDTYTSTVAAGTLPGCHGESPPFDAIFDMSGNVAEWEDGCEGGACPSRGGWIGSTTADLACDADNSQLDTEYNDDTGFRCCSK